MDSPSSFTHFETSIIIIIMYNIKCHWNNWRKSKKATQNKDRSFKVNLR